MTTENNWAQRIAGAHEVQQQLGVNQVRFKNFTSFIKTPFPKPVRKLKRGDIYDLAEVAAWARTYPHFVPADAPIRDWEA